MISASACVRPADSSAWLQARVVFGPREKSLVGVDYAHHHDPVWTPTQGSPWNVASTVTYQSFQGIDCTNLTAYVYADALGIDMNSKTSEQALISPSDPNGTTIPGTLSQYVSIQNIDPTSWSSYQDLLDNVSSRATS